MSTRVPSSIWWGGTVLPAAVGFLVDVWQFSSTVKFFMAAVAGIAADPDAYEQPVARLVAKLASCRRKDTYTVTGRDCLAARRAPASTVFWQAHV